MNLEIYLNKIQSTESPFGIDSFSKQKKKKRYSYKLLPDESWIIIEEKRVMIDLDGTIHKYSKGYADGQLYDKPFAGAKRVIKWLKDQGYEIVIFTTRASKENSEETGEDYRDQITNVKKWLSDNDIYFDRITAEKLAADFYIDDKAIAINNGDWNTVLKIIKARLKYSQM